MADNQTFEQARAVVDAWLKAHRLRRTAERLAILQSVCAQKKAFRISDIIAGMNASDFSVSRSTAYEAIRLFEQCGLLQKLPLADDEAYYAPPRGAHFYLACRSCGKIRHFDDPTIATHLKGRRFESFTVDYFAVVAHGICSVCKRRLRRNNAESSRTSKK